MTLIRRLLIAVRKNTVQRAIGFRLAQLAYANSHPGDAAGLPLAAATEYDARLLQ